MKKQLTAEQLTATILELTRKYVLQYPEINTAYDINNGWCCEFAEDLVNLFGGEADNFRIFSPENFRSGEDGEVEGDDIWDIKLMQKYWKKVVPAHGLSWEDLQLMPYGYHVWIYFDGKHYDAECPKGTDNFFELPLFENVQMNI